MFKRAARYGRQYWQLSLTTMIIIVSLILQLVHWTTVEHWLLGTVSLLMAIPLVVEMWQNLRGGSYGLDILAVTAIVASVLLHQYWAAIVIVLMLTGGRALETYAERRARSELDTLLRSAPQQAHVFRGRKVVDVAASSIQPGDKIIIKPGELVPVDATIIEGSSSFDEASLTGESLPASKTVNEQVLSSAVNLEGAITARALHSAADSQYQQIVKLVKAAAAQPAPFVRLADRFSIPFTVLSFAIAGAAWALSGHAIRFLEVIVVATPCPLLLATPIAFISGMSRASRYGIIVRTGSALERLADIQTIAFDKTGTLTQGKVAVSKVTALGTYTSDEVLGLAASLEQSSNHVLAKAVVDAATAAGLKINRAKHVREIPGHGLQTSVKGHVVLVGQRRLLEDHGVTIPASIKPGHETTTYIAVGDALAGYITFKDELRPETATTLTKLRKFGIVNMLMITGDSQSTAEAVTTPLGITEVRAEALPADKLHALDAITKRPVAFVGDGVNDAPVLTAADIGIALGARGSTAASESADVVIMRDSFALVALAVAIARRTFSIARQSILIGIGLSVALMLIFATGRFSPLLGAIIQEVVDVIVILNALRAHTSKDFA